MSRQTALWLNIVIVAIYVTIAIFAPTPWIMLAGFLGLAVTIRCGTLCWAAFSKHRDPSLSRKAAVATLGFNLVLGLLSAGALITALYWFGYLWLAAVKILVPIISVYVAYQSTFPLFPSGTTVPPDAIL